MPLVEVPNHGQVEFPDTMSDEEISSVIRENYAEFKQPRFDPEKGPPDFGPETPREARLSAEIEYAQAHPLTAPIARPFSGALNLGAVMGWKAAGMPGDAPEIEDIASSPSVDKATRIGAGAVKAVADLGDFFTSPLGVATLGIGSIPSVAQRAVGLAFATHMGMQTPAIAQELGTEIGKPEEERDYGKISELITAGAANTALAAVAGGKALSPKPKSAAEVVADQIKPVAPLTAEALKETGAPKAEPTASTAGTTEVSPVRPAAETVAEVAKPAEVVPKVEPAPVETAAEPAAFPKSELAKLSDKITDMAIEAPKETKLSEVFDIGQSAEGVKETAKGAVEGLKAAGTYLKQKLINKPVWTEYKDALGQRHLELSESAHNAKKFSKISEKSVPDKTAQEAISDYIDAGGDPSVLARAAAETKGRYKAGYEAAQKLSPEHKAIADEIKTYFEARLEEARDAGILEDGIEDYIHRTYESESPWKSGVLAELRSGINTSTPSLAKKRVFEYDFEAEKAGLNPIKSFIKRVAAYDLSLNKAMADRKLVKSMMEIKMPDGRPMIDVGGIGIPIEKAGVTDATLIKPHFKPGDTQNPKNNRSDYKPYDYPALRKWKWVSNDAEGKPIFVQGDVLIHPEAMKKVRVLFERSAIRQNPIGRGALALSSTIKQTMLDLSGFHLAQITVHGWEHRSFKPVKEIDFTNPDVRGLIKGGLVVGDTRGYEMFSEGLAGSSLTKHIPGVGPKLQEWNQWLFNSYIPRLKVSTGLHALERNRARFPELSPEEVNHLTSNQMNAAFGELNYEMLGRSKTAQDMWRLALLAPDFLEARGRFAAQAGTKYGREQFTALMLGGATLYITARIMNKLLTGSYHMEPKNAFSIVHDGKAYSLRTVQGDILHLAAEPGRFFYNRLNPVYGRTGFEFLTGRDSFGRKRDFSEQVQDFATTGVPISLRGLLNPTEQTLMESMLNAFGITERRSSAITLINELAQEFKEEKKIRAQPGEFIYDPDKDPFRPIRQSALFLDPEDVAKQIDKAVKSGEVTRDQIRRHFVNYSQSTFTGTRKTDSQFVKSLTEDQKKIYQDALKEKRELFKKFNAGYQIYLKNTQPKTSP